MKFIMRDNSMQSAIALSGSAGYPVIEVRGKNPATGEERLIGPCTFHSIMKKTDRTDFSGMGLTIIGNMVRGLKNGDLPRDWRYRIALIMGQGAKPIILPWPGMPDASPLPLDVDKLPFDYSMFLDPITKWARRRLDRLKLMDQIDLVWTPYVVKLIKREGSNARLN